MHSNYINTFSFSKYLVYKISWDSFRLEDEIGMSQKFWKNKFCLQSVMQQTLFSQIYNKVKLNIEFYKIMPIIFCDNGVTKFVSLIDRNFPKIIQIPQNSGHPIKLYRDNPNDIQTWKSIKKLKLKFFTILVFSSYLFKIN